MTVSFQIVEEKFNKITKYLIQNQLSITTMESCTSGFIASLITDAEGSSSIFHGAYVTYSNEMKVKEGVAKEIIETYGVYSEETATAMALNCKQNLHASIGIGITGTFCNVDPNNKDSIPGEVYFSIAYENEIVKKRICLGNEDSRVQAKICVADYIANEIMLHFSIQ